MDGRLTGTGPGGGKTANRGRTLGAALEKEDRAIYWKGGAKALKKEMNQSRKSL